ncbi:MAG TPA: hypothetical protein DCY27_06100 [Desulfobacterales bacterium]|nr:hypothetical protein [Desulfobacterales bacterium]
MVEEENLAGLLLLGCLVGVVMFICFALATLNLMASREELDIPVPDAPSLVAQRDALLGQRQGIQGAQKNLESDIDYVKGKIAQAAKQLAAFQKTQSMDHTQEIHQIRQEIDTLEKEKQGLLNDLNAKKRDINKVNVWQELGGTIRFKNPLFLECQARIVMVHPGKKVLNMPDLNRKDSLRGYAQGCDGIVLLVRPDGFKTFDAAFLQAKKTGLKLAYEPVDASWQLDFSTVMQP